ncbi:hypothetical protein [Sphingomonas abaci]|uniref:Uncharacterized protein n=1 Tax=Sphingomonas abaci TaxID=237611 RepID=A0A7W7AH49_9SPHN|nr:hypothetical protein [Sphingomonas abaci]MBB4616929.1 hypothetical protein [Sphingomonas abaci]
MKRADVLKAIHAAGVSGDRRAFLRLYTEHRISLDVARAEYAAGQEMAKNFADRPDVQRKPENLYMEPRP